MVLPKRRVRHDTEMTAAGCIFILVALCAETSVSMSNVNM